MKRAEAFKVELLWLPKKPLAKGAEPLERTARKEAPEPLTEVQLACIEVTATRVKAAAPGAAASVEVAFPALKPT